MRSFLISDVSVKLGRDSGIKGASVDVEGALPEVEYGAPSWGMPPWVDGGILPSFTHIDGRNVALVDAGEFRALLTLAELVSDPERVRTARAAVAAGAVGEGDPPPVAEQVSGVDLVTIPRAYFAELLDCRRLVTEAGVEKWQYRGDARSRIERDPEVATFLTEHMGKALLKEVHALCRQRFGAERTPGQSTIGRFWSRLGRKVR